MKEKYIVFWREVSENDGITSIGEWRQLGTTFATSSKRAINNIKYRNNISAGSCGTDYFNYHYEFKAEVA